MLPEVKQVPLDVLLESMVVNVLARVSGDQISLAELQEKMLLIYSRAQQEPAVILQSLDVALKRMKLEGKIVVSGQQDIPLFTNLQLP